MRDRMGHPLVKGLYSGFMRSDNELLSGCNVFVILPDFKNLLFFKKKKVLCFLLSEI